MMIHEGVANKRYRNPVLPVKCLFKWQNNGHMIHKTAYFFDPSLAPGPDLRTDVIQHRNGMFFGKRRQV